MLQAFVVVILFAVIQVINSDCTVRFHKSTGQVNVRFENAEIIYGVESDVHCAVACDGYTWCNAITWEGSNRTCQGFTRTLTQEALPSGVSNFYINGYGQLDECVGDGYTYIAGMCIKFFPDKAQITWQQAEDFCVCEGGRLVVTDNQEKLNYVQNQVANNPTFNLYNKWWIGAVKDLSGTWKWTSGRTLSEDISILVNQPTTAFCLGFYNKILDDYVCGLLAKPVCEK